MKLYGIVAGLLVVLFGAGWIVGQSGKSALATERRLADERANFSEVRALTLDGRVSLFLVNFGDASRRFEEARATAERIQTGLREVGQAERAGRLEVVVAHLRDAQRLAASLDASAQNAAAEALRVLAAVSTP